MPGIAKALGLKFTRHVFLNVKYSEIMVATL